MSKRQQKPGLIRDRTPFELGVLIVSAAAIVAIIAGLVFGALSTSDDPPDLRLSLRPLGEASGGTAFELTVTNAGGRTAESVVVEVSAGPDKREAQFVAVARGDSERATVVFPPGTNAAPGAQVLAYTESAR